MQALASFTMRGRSQATLVAATAAVLSLIVPLVGLVSSAVVALVTLRKGASEGLVVGLLAGVASGVLAYLALGSPLPAIGFAMALWLPVWVLGVVLRNTRSLNLTVQLAALFGFLILIGIWLQTADPEAYWIEVLEPVRQSLVEGKVIEATASEALLARVAQWMTGAFAATFYLQILLALFLGRWWQALLYNPGGFGTEFRTLRVHPAAGYLGLALILAAMLQDEQQWTPALLLVLTPLFLLQGLAVLHGLAGAFKIGRGWLVGFYLLLVVAMPHAEILVAGLGLADVWTDLRSRTQGRTGQGPD